VRVIAASRRFWAAIAVVVILVAMEALTGSGARGLGAVRGLMLEAIAPFATALSAAEGAVRSADASVAELVALRSENLKLQREVTALGQESTALQELTQENARLRALLDLRSSLTALLPYPAGSVAARVIARSPTTWWSSVLLDKGSADGIRANMIAMAPSGLVGRVSSLTPHTATVTLLTNPDSAVGGMVERASSRDAGIAFGVVGQSTLDMEFFDAQADVQVGDTIVTSGLGGIFPKGLPIGQVVSVAAPKYGQVRTAQVAPAVDLANLEELLLVQAPPGGSG
jgi:rod shape-determining protein MreC